MDIFGPTYAVSRAMFGNGKKRPNRARANPQSLAASACSAISLACSTLDSSDDFKGVSMVDPDALEMHDTSSEVQWEFLLRRTTIFATRLVSCFCWRGSVGGILPEGYDPTSVAAQAVAEWLQNAPDRANDDLQQFPLTQTCRDLEYLVRKQIHELRYRMENVLVCNEEDQVTNFLEDGEIPRLTESAPAPEANPSEMAVECEADVDVDVCQPSFEWYLRADTTVQVVLRNTFHKFSLNPQSRLLPPFKSAPRRGTSHH
jgi:hypothetical protein